MVYVPFFDEKSEKPSITLIVFWDTVWSGDCYVHNLINLINVLHLFVSLVIDMKFLFMCCFTLCFPCFKRDDDSLL